MKKKNRRFPMVSKREERRLIANGESKFGRTEDWNEDDALYLLTELARGLAMDISEFAADLGLVARDHYLIPSAAARSQLH